jgi:CTP:molybdopterin cytidylyltransferase MocA
VATGAILLAAGGSSRLGRPKQLVGIAGRPLVRAMAEQALASRCRPVRVILGSQAEAIVGALAGLSVSLTINDDWREGIASSIRAGIAAARAERWSAAVVMLGDQPGVLARHLDRLTEAYEAGARAVASRYAGRLGVPALFDASLFDALSALQGDRGAKSILARTPGVFAVDFPEGVLDVDTESDVARLRGPT